MKELWSPYIKYLCSPVVLEYLSWQDIPNPRIKPHQVTSAELGEHLKRNINAQIIDFLIRVQ